jgi:hypothetical protein
MIALAATPAARVSYPVHCAQMRGRTPRARALGAPMACADATQANPNPDTARRVTRRPEVVR